MPNRQSALDASVPSFMKQQKPVFFGSTNEKEIVSALVRLNSEGHNVPLNAADIKKLPVIPQTGARTMKKKYVTDLGPNTGFLSIHEKEDDYTDDDLELDDDMSKNKRGSSLSYYKNG